MAKFQNKYRIETTRLQSWDYGNNAAYFVTLCIRYRERLFGCIKNGVMTPNPLGKAARDCWKQIPNHFPFVVLGEFVIMPNHIHGIIIINKKLEQADDPNKNKSNLIKVAEGSDKKIEAGIENGIEEEIEGGIVDAQNLAYQLSPHQLSPSQLSQPDHLIPFPINPFTQNYPGNKFGPQSRNLASIIRGYKIGVTKFAKANKIPFEWQERYHDRIIRDYGEYQRIENYIINNPKNWKEDD